MELEVGFFSDRKRFFADFRKLTFFFSPELYFYKKKKKIREPLWIGQQVNLIENLNKKGYVQWTVRDITTRLRAWASGEGRRS